MKFSGFFCRYLLIWNHWPIHHPAGGWKCERCGTPGLTQGELLGADDTLNFWALSEASKRQLEGKSEPRPQETPIAQPGAAVASKKVLPGVFSKVAV